MVLQVLAVPASVPPLTLTTPAPHNANLSASRGLTDSELLLHFMPWGARLDCALTPALYVLGVAGNALAYRAWHSIHRSRHGLPALGLGGLESLGWPPPTPGAPGFEGCGTGNELEMGRAGGQMGALAGTGFGATSGGRKRPRVQLPPSARLYLSTLALVDGLFLITHVLHELQFAWSVRVLNFPIICDVYFGTVMLSEVLCYPLHLLLIIIIIND